LARNKRIRGITIEIGGDTTKLQTALKGVSSQMDKTQAQLKDVNRLLKLDPGNTELLSQKHKLLGQAVEETKQKLDTLKQASEQAAKTAVNYDAWKAKYDPIQQEISETQEHLKKLKEQSAEADKQLAEGKISQEKYDALQNEIAETSDHLKALKQDAEAVSDEFGHPISPEQYDALQREIIETTHDLEGLERQARQSGEMVQSIAAKGEKLKEMGDKVSSAGQALLPVTAAITATGGAAAAKFADVDKIMALTNETMKNTEEEAKLLEAAMEDAASKSTFGMSDAANAALNFARAGLDAKQAAAALAPAMNLAAGEGGNLDTVSAGLVGTINGFGDVFENAGYYADIFASACNNSALDIDSLSNSMSIAAPVFKAAGYSVSDAALYMGVMANNGIDANVAANALKTGIARLADPSKDAVGWINKLGLEIFNSDGTMKDSVTVQEQLHDAFAGLSEQEQIAAASAIFGKNQMSNWLALINTAPDDVRNLSGALGESAGTTNDMAAAMMDGFGGSIEQLKSTLDVFMVQMGRLIAEYLLPLINWLTSLLTWLTGLDDGTKRIIITVAALLAALGPLLIIIGTLMSSIGQIMTWAPIISGAITTFTGTLLPALQAGLSGLFATLLANPFALVVVAIAALVAAVIHLWNTNEEFRDTVIACWERVKEAFSGLAEALGGLLAALGIQFQGFGEGVSAIWDALCQFLAPVLEVALETITETLEATLQALTGLLEIFSGVFSGDWEKIWQGVADFLDGIWRMMTSGAFGWGADLVSNLIAGITSKLSSLWNTMKNVAAGIRRFIGFSEPEDGPLSNFHTYAPDMMKLFAQGILDNQGPVQSAMTRAFAPPEYQVPDTYGAPGGGAGMPERIPTGLAQGRPAQQTIIMQVDRTQFARLVHELNNEENQRLGVQIGR
jgi:TP901 family phage tail tape measure protein